jgi:hypothetical protein
MKVFFYQFRKKITKKPKLLVFFLTIILSTYPSFAIAEKLCITILQEGSNIHGYKNWIDLHVGVVKYPNRPKRMKIATELYDELKRLNGLVPDLSPKEKKWLSKELKSAFPKGGLPTKRFVRAMKSTEFKISKLKNRTNELEGMFKYISKPTTDLRKELMSWAMIIHHLSSEALRENLRILKRRNILTYQGPISACAINLIEEISNDILARNIHQLKN